MSPNQRSSLLQDAIPDLVMGLLGVPVAFAVQNIAQQALGLETAGSVGSHQVIRDTRSVTGSSGAGFPLDCLLYIGLFLALYVVYAISMLRVLEKRRRLRDVLWVILVLGSISAAAVMLAGIYYPDLAQTQRYAVLAVLLSMLTLGLYRWQLRPEERWQLKDFDLDLAHLILVVLVLFVLAYEQISIGM